MAFELPKLPYATDALEPHIDARTMEIHHGKHHAGYTNNLNAAIEGSDLEGLSIEEILVKGADKAAVRNNGGGYYNHRSEEHTSELQSRGHLVCRLLLEKKKKTKKIIKRD